MNNAIAYVFIAGTCTMLVCFTGVFFIIVIAKRKVSNANFQLKKKEAAHQAVIIQLNEIKNKYFDSLKNRTVFTESFLFFLVDIIKAVDDQKDLNESREQFLDMYATIQKELNIIKYELYPIKEGESFQKIITGFIALHNKLYNNKIVVNKISGEDNIPVDLLFPIVRLLSLASEELTQIEITDEELTIIGKMNTYTLVQIKTICDAYNFECIDNKYYIQINYQPTEKFFTLNESENTERNKK
ncbi:MAG: hypothetical protein V4538_01535 [Bacteroidota bacterium]